jgi:hypothetical protein
MFLDILSFKVGSLQRLGPILVFLFVCLKGDG